MCHLWYLWWVILKLHNSTKLVLSISRQESIISLTYNLISIVKIAISCCYWLANLISLKKKKKKNQLCFPNLISIFKIFNFAIYYFKQLDLIDRDCWLSILFSSWFLHYQNIPFDFWTLKFVLVNELYKMTTLSFSSNINYTSILIKGYYIGKII